MIEPKQYKVVRAECPLCGKVLEGISEKHWMKNLNIHLRLAQNHMLPQEKVDLVMKTVKPAFRTAIKVRYHMK